MNEKDDQQENAKNIKQQEEKLENFKKRVETASSAMNIVYKLAAGIGALTTFSYLLIIQFFPSGLTPGEVIFFVFIALAFAFTYAVIVTYGAFSSIWFAHLVTGIAKLASFPKRRLTLEIFSSPAEDAGSTQSKQIGLIADIKQGWRSRRFAATRAVIEKSSLVPSFLRGWGYGLISFALFALFAITAYEAHFTQFTEFLFGCALAGFVALMFLDPPSSVKPSNQSILIRIIGISVLPLVIVCIYAGPTALLNIVFEGLGIRAQDVSIELPESETGSIERIQELVRRPLLDCRKPQPGKILVHGADILWTGVGEQTLVQFGTGKKSDRTIFSPRQSTFPVGTLKLDTKSIQIIKAVPRIDPCFDLSSDLLFDVGKYDLMPRSVTRIRDLSDSITRFGKPKRIIIRGHSDPRRIRVAADGSKTDNQQLSERRAATIAAFVKHFLNDPNIEIVSEGAGSRELRLKCQQDTNTTNYEIDQCNRPNRRVEVRVAYTR